MPPAPRSNPRATASPGGERLVAFDVLRGGAMLLGVVFHAAIAYMEDPPQQLIWLVHDRARSWGYDLFFWLSHGFRIPLFFLVAGFFAETVIRRRGLRGFVASRTRRLLAPLAASCALVLPLMYFVWCWGWIRAGRCTLPEVLAVKFADPVIQSEFFGPAHLWFLEELFLVSMLYAGLRAIGGPRRGHTPDATREPLSIRGLSIAAPLLSWLVLALDPAVVLGFRNSFVPWPGRLAWNACFFVAGAWLHGRPDTLRGIGRLTGALLGVSILSGAALVRLPSPAAQGPLFEPAGRLLVGAALALFAWSSVLGFLGLALRTVFRAHGAVRTLADSAYWVYLTHLPVVGLGQIVLVPVPLPAPVKHLTVTALAVGLCLLAHRFLVRDRALGHWLGGAHGRP